MSKLLFQGEVLGRFETKFKDRETNKELITKKVQFLNEENGKISITEIKLNPEQDLTEIVKGVKIMIPIKLYTPKDTSLIYMSQNGEIKINK